MGSADDEAHAKNDIKTSIQETQPLLPRKKKGSSSKDLFNPPPSNMDHLPTVLSGSHKVCDISLWALSKGQSANSLPIQVSEMQRYRA